MIISFHIRAIMSTGIQECIKTQYIYTKIENNHILQLIPAPENVRFTFLIDLVPNNKSILHEKTFTISSNY